MLDAIGKFDIPADKEGHTYRDLFAQMRAKWGKAVDTYNSMGAWKDSLIACSVLMDNLMRIAVKENLLSVSRDMYNISLAGLGGLGPAPPDEGGVGPDIPPGGGPPAGGASPPPPASKPMRRK